MPLESIAFRIQPSQLEKLLRLRDTFPDQGWRTTMGWLLDQPEVMDVINRRLSAERLQQAAANGHPE